MTCILCGNVNIEKEDFFVFGKDGKCEKCGGKVEVYNEMGKEDIWIVSPCKSCEASYKTNYRRLRYGNADSKI